MTPWLLAVHVLGIALWIGGLLGAAAVLAQAASAEAAARATVAQAARKLMRVLGDPGAGLAIASGVWMLSADAAGYFAMPWFQTKMVVAVGVVAIHGVIAVRAKRAAAGAEVRAGQAWGWFAAVALAAAAMVLLSLPGRMM